MAKMWTLGDDEDTMLQPWWSTGFVSTASDFDCAVGHAWAEKSMGINGSIHPTRADLGVIEYQPSHLSTAIFQYTQEQDYLARGFDKKDPDFRTDDLILQKD